jgi:hypothetical protein
MALSAHRQDFSGAAPHLLFFTGIGLGFMLIEISQVQRLAVFLGHPAYSLSVVLFSILLSSGAGSLSTGRIRTDRDALARIVALVLVLVAFGAITPAAIRQFESGSTLVRILVSVSILLPLGFVMGMAFPIGMARALREAPAMAPWLWGVNGAASVCASVVSVVIAIGAGISASFWAGVACYLVALAAFSRHARPALAASRAEQGTL